MQVSKAMPDTNTETPDWLREMETILEEFNEGVIVADDQLRVIFANEGSTTARDYPAVQCSRTRQLLSINRPKSLMNSFAWAVS